MVNVDTGSGCLIYQDRAVPCGRYACLADEGRLTLFAISFGRINNRIKLGQDCSVKLASEHETSSSAADISTRTKSRTPSMHHHIYIVSYEVLSSGIVVVVCGGVKPAWRRRVVREISESSEPRNVYLHARSLLVIDYSISSHPSPLTRTLGHVFGSPDDPSSVTMLSGTREIQSGEGDCSWHLYCWIIG